MHQRVSQPRCRHSPRASLQYPVHGPCVAALAAPGFHRGDAFRPAASKRPSCQTLGVTRNVSVNLMPRAIAPKPSRQAIQCVSAPAGLYVRAMPTLRPRSEERPFVAVAKVVGYSLKRTTRAPCHHRAKAFRAQLVPALARRRRQMVVSQWALPLSERRRDLRAAVPRGSGVGGVQAVPRFSTVGDAQPFVQADGFAAA